MNDSDDWTGAGRKVPGGRIARLGVFGRLAGGVAGGMLAEGARRLAAGERPQLRDMMLTPANAARVAEQLAQLRGAAMKLGQMISMDAGDLLPPELARIMARLREHGYRMPPAQLQQVLAREWGGDWRRRFARFDATPIAAASIGQVHRATLPDGRLLAIKVQYPGVRESIVADVDNVATLLRVANLLPPELDLKPLLEEAKRQLAEEADYRREGAQMTRYAALLADSADYVVPALEPALTTDRVLAMGFVEGRPIETLADAAQAERDAAMTGLIALVLRELFVFGVMQSDPNFANYRWQPDTGRIVLLDFGATRDIAPGTVAAYRALLQAGLSSDRDAIRTALVESGFLGAATVQAHRPAIDRMIDAVLTTLDRPGAFDFGDRAFVPTIRDEAGGVLADRATWQLPPIDALFVQRKVSGTALLAARLQARVDVRGLADAALKPGGSPAASDRRIGAA